MRLEKLVINGFKSFADKTTFEFKENLTAIVGPNGSGKSNVSDAIRWVLGEQSVKTLRGKQSSDLIFSGSDKLAKLGMAQVELYLDNSKGEFPLDYQEVVIARKLFRNGESEFRINGSKVRLQDIVMMLAKAKFGQKSYAVIGQGMVTHFLTASPEERKIFFDEATGVREYQIKRDQAINKLIRTEENLIQSETLLTEIEPHLKSLARQVKRLERREKIETQLREIQVDYYGQSWEDLNKERGQLENQFKGFDTEIVKLDNELAEKSAASDALASESSRGERYQELQKEFNALLEQKSHLLKEQAVLKGKLEVEHERQGELSLVWLQRKEDDLVKDIHTQEAEMQLIKQQVTADQSELARKEKELESLLAEFREEEYEILKLREQIEQETHAMTVPEIQVQLRDLYLEQEELLRELMITKSMAEFRSVQTTARKFNQRFTDFMERLNSDERETVEALRVEMKRKEQLLGRLVADKETLQNKINALKVNVESAHSKSSFLHKQLSRLQDDLAEIQGNIEETAQEASMSAKAGQARQFTQELAQFDKQIEVIDKKNVALRAEIDNFNEEEEKKKSRLVEIQSVMRSVQRKLTNVRQQSNTVEVNLARVETRQEDLETEIKREVPENLHDSIYEYEKDKEVLSHQKMEAKMVSLHRQLEAIGSVDQETIQEFEETKERFEFLSEQTTDLSKSIGSLEKVIDELDITIKAEFQKNFKKINEDFQKYFKVLFEGGKSKLQLMTDADKVKEEAAQENSGDKAAAGEGDNPVVADAAQAVEVSGESLHDEKERELIGKKKKRQKVVSGIEIIASPPGKKVSNIAALSGGEKSLVSIALLCSIIANNPSPFVVLDEVEAALDEENSEKLAAIIKQLSTKTQIIVITHNRVTMKSTDILYGVTMGKEGKSHILSVELKEAQELVEDDD